MDPRNRRTNIKLHWLLVIFYGASTRSCLLFRIIKIRVAVLFQVLDKKSELLLRDREAAGSHAGRQRAPHTNTVSFSAGFQLRRKKMILYPKNTKVVDVTRGVSSERSPWACPTAYVRDSHKHRKSVDVIK